MSPSPSTLDLEPPALSVIVPARNCAEYLRACLSSLRTSSFTDYELIVVDDASDDDTADAARAAGATVLRQPERGGPAAARNRGAEAAVAPYLLFVDADVCVHDDTLERVMAVFREDATVDGFFGSYDPAPSASNFLSQYRNLSHHFVHQDGNVESSTFWAGCGAVKTEVFRKLGGFDPVYSRPSIEDIELGGRMKKAGHRVLLRREIQVTHLKRWNLWSMCVADVRDRALPWTQLILREGAIPNDLNLKLQHRVATVLSYGLVAGLIAGAWYFHGILLLPILAMLALLIFDYWSEERRAPTALRVLAVVMVLGAIGAIAFYFQMWLLVMLALLLGIVLINLRFYLFFARERHPLFAALVVPVHVLYYIYSGAAFAIGVALHAYRIGLGGRPRPRARSG